MTNDPALRGRDIFTALAVALLTVVLLTGAIEGAGWLLYRESSTTTLPCLVINDRSTGVTAIPGSECHQRSRESTLVDYRFNRCGHRMPVDCGPKPAGTLRIVLIGSSFGYGMHVDQDQSFATRLPQLLTQQTGAKVDLYNESMQWGFPSSVILRLDEVIAAQPDVILWPITPTDIGSAELITPQWLGSPATAAPPLSAWQRVLHAWAEKGPAGFFGTIRDRIDDYLNDTGFMFLLKHVLYQNGDFYIRQYLARQDDGIAYLRTTPSAVLDHHLQRFAECLAEVRRRASAAGAIVVVTSIPDRAQAAMISRHEWPAGADPYRFGNAIRRIAEDQGVTYLDVPRRFSTITSPERHYFPLDGHPDAQGHAVIAATLAGAMLDARVLSGLKAGAQ
jgi:hypothetical protein